MIQQININNKCPRCIEGILYKNLENDEYCLQCGYHIYSDDLAPVDKLTLDLSNQIVPVSIFVDVNE